MGLWHQGAFSAKKRRGGKTTDRRVTMITVYTKPDCVQCTATKKALDKAGLAYTVVDITTDDAARDRVLALGYLQAPVVITNTTHWAGFRPDNIRNLVA
jgi:ribonucleoside-diphosphate reductase class Ib glutaredoxin subunit (EC 1.17.4.1)